MQVGRGYEKKENLFSVFKTVQHFCIFPWGGRTHWESIISKLDNEQMLKGWQIYGTFYTKMGLVDFIL